MKNLNKNLNELRLSEAKKMLSGEIFYAACKSRLNEQLNVNVNTNLKNKVNV